MNIGSVRAGDIVRCDVRGDRFYAVVPEKWEGGPLLPVESLSGRPIPTFHVKARQVVGHWRKSKQSKV
jgi:hypothetical protein